MKFYHKYLFLFSIPISLILLFHLGLFYVNLGIPNSLEKRLYTRYEHKDMCANSIIEPKIIFISGSNTLFGVDCERIEQQLGIPTINYGTDASMHFYTIHRAKPHLRKGDIVILPLEYSFYDYHNDIFEKGFTFYILGYDPEYFYNLSLYQKLCFISQTNTEYLIDFTIQQFYPEPPKESPYDTKYLNNNGDMTYYSSKQQKTAEELKTVMQETVFKDTPVTNDSKAELVDFINFCQNNNITVYASWPVFLWHDKEFTDNDLKGIHAIEDFYRAHNVEILGNYTDCLYDIDLFYDTRYHLNAEGKRIHTEYLINLLRDKVHK